MIPETDTYCYSKTILSGFAKMRLKMRNLPINRLQTLFSAYSVCCLANKINPDNFAVIVLSQFGAYNLWAVIDVDLFRFFLRHWTVENMLWTHFIGIIVVANSDALLLIAGAHLDRGYFEADFSDRIISRWQIFSFWFANISWISKGVLQVDAISASTTTFFI